MSDQHRVNGTFLSEKISKIRWIPEQYTAPDSFVTGSWDFQPNSVKVWKLISGTSEYASGDDLADESIPKCTAELPVNGDVTGLQFVDADHIVVGSTDGQVTVVNIDRNLARQNLRERVNFGVIHRFDNQVAAACNALATYEHQVATVGEDGRLNVLAINQKRLFRSFDAADSCSLTCVAFVSDKEIFTGNRMGLIKMFDIRSDRDAAQSSFQISCDDEKKSNGATCLAQHPTQSYILLSGSEEGSITVWDLRNPGYAASYLTAHDSAITELGYHPTEPTKLFSASEGGELYQWSQTNSGHIMDGGGVDGQLKYDESEQISPWLSGERIKNKINWTPLINGLRKAINSFDASGARIISSCDNEAVYLVENII